MAAPQDETVVGDLSYLEPADPRDLEPDNETSEIRVMIAGGLGKSTGLENIFGWNHPVNESDTTTGPKKVAQVKIRKNKIFLTATEIPQLTAANTFENEVIVRDMKNLGIKSSFLLILTLPVMPDASINEDYRITLKTLNTIFGPKIWDWCLVLLTFSDSIRETTFPSDSAQQTYIDHLKDQCTQLQKELKNIGVEKSVKSFFEYPTKKQFRNESLDGIVAIPVGENPDVPTERLLPLQPWTHEYEWTHLAYMTIVKLNKNIPKANILRWAFIQFRYGCFTLKDRKKAIVKAAVGGAVAGVLVGGATGAGIGAGVGTVVEPGGGTLLGGLLGGGIGAVAGGITGAIGTASGAAAVIMIDKVLKLKKQQ